MSFLDNIEFDDEEEKEEEVKKEELKPFWKMQFTQSIDFSIRKEIRELKNAGQEHVAEEIEANWKKIAILFADAQHVLFGCREIDPVKKYIRGRINTLLPLPYCYDERPFTNEDWGFIQSHQPNYIRILYGTFAEYSFPADMLCGWYRTIFEDLRMELTHEHRKSFQARMESIETRLGYKKDEIERHLRSDPGAQLEEVRLKKRVFDACVQQGLNENLVNDLLKNLPSGLLSLSLDDNNNSDEPVEINPSREGSPVPIEEEDTVSDEEEDDVPYEDNFERLLSGLNLSNVKQSAAVIQKKGILRKEPGWYRSDGFQSKKFEKTKVTMTYARYRTTKKNVSFADCPTECCVYVHDVSRRLTNFADKRKWHGSGYAHGMRMSYEEFLTIHSLKNKHPRRSASTGGVISKRAKKDRASRALAEKLHPTNFILAEQGNRRRNFADCSEVIAVPAHVGYRNVNLGEVPAPSSLIDKNLQKLLYFTNTFSSSAVNTSTVTKSIENYCAGILIVTDGVLEEINGDTLLNAAICSFPPPLELNDALDILANTWEASEHIRDVIVSWGFDEIVETRNEMEAFASLLTAARQIKDVLMINCEKINKERESWDAPATPGPRLWVFTIPEEGTFTDEFRKYNLLVKMLCDENEEFNLLDWADLWTFSPPYFKMPIHHEGGTERSLALFFRLCRDNMDLLYRRADSERTTSFERRTVSSNFGCGPWPKYFEIEDKWSPHY